MMKVCNSCHGNGFLTAMVDGAKVHGMRHITCTTCKGAGEVDPSAQEWEHIGTTHRTWRVAQHEGLAACGERLGIDPRTLNDMEHGRADPTPLLADIPEVLRAYEKLPDPPKREAA